MATAYYMELVIEMTNVATDQEHLPMIVYSRPDTPDRTQYILGLSARSPVPSIIETGRKLADQGVEAIAIPCITAHYFHDEIQKNVDVPILHLVRETVKHLKENHISRVGVMATDGTIQSGLFQKELAKENMEAVIPTPARQKDVMHLIYQNVKAGIPADMDVFNRVVEELRMDGAQAIVLGCTELSIIKRDYPLGEGFLDAMEVLAKVAIESCQAPLKPQYRCLITRENGKGRKEECRPMS